MLHEKRFLFALEQKLSINFREEKITKEGLQRRAHISWSWDNKMLENEKIKIKNQFSANFT